MGSEAPALPGWAKGHTASVGKPGGGAQCPSTTAEPCNLGEEPHDLRKEPQNLGKEHHDLGKEPRDRGEELVPCCPPGWVIRSFIHSIHISMSTYCVPGSTPDPGNSKASKGLLSSREL